MRLMTAALFMLLLAGCGQTGALYFDEAPPADQLPPSRKQSVAPLPVMETNKTPAAAPAPTEDKKE